MKTALIILAALAPSFALAQAASTSETAIVASIAQCLVQGAPQGWQRLYMVVELKEPLAQTGDVRYVAERDGEREAYVPCDVDDGSFHAEIEPGVYRVTAFSDCGRCSPQGLFVVADRLAIP